MRIGIDARLWNETGVGRYIRNLVWELEKIDTKNTYILFVQKGVTQKQLNTKFRIVETDIHWHTIEEQLLFYKVLENELLDLVHFPYFSVPILYTRPFVITIHDLILNHYPTGKASTLPLPLYYMKHFAYQFVMKQAAKKTEQVITVSEATKREIIKHLHVPKEKIVVTYEGVDERVSKTIQSKAAGDGAAYFLYVGNAYPHKNLERLIEAFGQVIKEKPESKLTLVGKDDYFYKRLREKVTAFHLEQTIVFRNNVNDEELNSLYDGAVALITPSLMEGFGLPGLESMQHGTLVLASDIPVYREIYKNAAVYFDPRDTRSMRATILRVLQQHTSYNKHIEKGFEVVKGYSWGKMAKETLNVYESSVGIRQS